MDVRQLNKDVQEGKVSCDELAQIIRQQEQTIHRLEARVKWLEHRLAQHESPPPVETPERPTDYSLGTEEKRRRRRRS